MTKEIQLTQGKVAIVDDHQYERASQLKWWAKLDKKNGFWYAHSRYNGKAISLHRFLTNAPSGMVIDHKDRDGLNCTDENMRICTHGQNMFNKIKPINNTSGYKGVVWNKQNKKWAAQINAWGKHIHLGYFENILDAALARDAAARELHGEFAYTNFPAPTGD